MIEFIIMQGPALGHSLSPSKLWVCRLPFSVVNSYYLDLFGSVCSRGSKLEVDLALFRLGDCSIENFQKIKKGTYELNIYEREFANNINNVAIIENFKTSKLFVG